ncbi:HIT family protein [Dyella sp. A6]|uniref:HIT family protein n=1 Tax=Dyella aluminiiresistens TaxID=3069105 RepID=UPI002E7A5ACC|nr:HIT family protein [Dyella sp. A6]
MSNESFTLDPRLQADTHGVATLSLCDVLLMDDDRFPWLILVPRTPGCAEVSDLPVADQARLWHEVAIATAALRAVVSCDKINLGALGNIVRQLHVHVVARREGDAAWPGPVWGSGQAPRREAPARELLVERLRAALSNDTVTS